MDVAEIGSRLAYFLAANLEDSKVEEWSTVPANEHSFQIRHRQNSLDHITLGGWVREFFTFETIPVKSSVHLAGEFKQTNETYRFAISNCPEYKSFLGYIEVMPRSTRKPS